MGCVYVVCVEGCMGGVKVWVRGWVGNMCVFVCVGREGGGMGEGVVSQEGFACVCVWEFVPRFLLVCGRRLEGSGRGGVRFSGGSISRCFVFFGVSGLLS